MRRPVLRVPAETATSYWAPETVWSARTPDMKMSQTAYAWVALVMHVEQGVVEFVTQDQDQLPGDHSV